MTSRTFYGVCALFAGVAALHAVRPFDAAAQAPAGTAQKAVMPQYDSEGALRLPGDYRRWVFAGSSLGLSYTQGQPGMEMFHETLIEPTAYDHFVETGTFREGTMLVLLLHGIGEGAMPARRGRFAAEIHGVEMAVKDTAHRPEGWAYYNFGGMNGIRPTAQAMPKESCYNCHVEHAASDNVFLQFYSMLADASRVPIPRRTEAAASAAERPTLTNTQTARAAAPAARLALRGLDPVMLVTGQEEMGKPEIIADHEGYRYQFVSEPNRVKFQADVERFSIQNDTCPVVAGAPVDPSRFAVHEGRIYGFATDNCIVEFKQRPTDFVKP